MRVLIANIGLRDLRYYLAPGQADPPGFYDFAGPSARQVADALGTARGARFIAPRIGELLREDRAATLERVRYPIVRTALQRLTRRPLERVVLIGTDQPKKVAAMHRAGDTLETARVLAELIHEQYRPERVGQVLPVAYNHDASEEDRAYERYRALLERALPVEDVGQEGDEVYVLTSAGIPALNRALQQQAMYLYGSQVRLLTVRPPTEEENLAGTHTGKLRAVSTEPFVRDLARVVLQRLLDRGDMLGALTTLESLRVSPFWDERLLEVLRHVHHRQHYDYAAAANAIEHRRNEAPFGRWYETACEASLFHRLVDTWSLIRSHVTAGQATEATWRLGTFYENGLRLLAHVLYPAFRLDDLLVRQLPDGTVLGPSVYRRLVEEALDGTADPQADSLHAASGDLQLLRGLYDRRNTLLHNMQPAALTTLPTSDYLDSLLQRILRRLQDGGQQPGPIFDFFDEALAEARRHLRW